MVELWAARVLQAGRGLHRRMARAGRRLASFTRSANPAQLRGQRAPRNGGSALGGRRSMASLVAGLACLFLASAQAQLVSSRIWPARDYTRLTLESKSVLKYQLFAVKDPERLVHDLKADM